ncbi:MAG: DUF3325 family protein [Alphaproteobacteria bacterium]|nr:DUF3325 family protein [Alphaproteobacteria bacterium]
MSALSAFILAFAGFAALALAMDRHHRTLFDRAPGRGAALTLRLAGTAGLAASLFACADRWGWAIGAIAWFGVLSAVALGVVLLLAALPRRTGRTTRR